MMITTRAPTTFSDPELMRQVAKADVAAFEVMYDRYASQAFSLAVRITRHRGAAGRGHAGRLSVPLAKSRRL